MSRQTWIRLAASLLLLPGLVACAPQDGGTDNGGSSSNAVLMPVANDPTVSFTVWFQAGSVHDPVGKEGLAALTGALIEDGSTQAHPYEEILELLYPLASGYSVRVDKEMTTLTGRTHRDNLDAFFELFRQAYQQPAFAEEDFERLKADQLNYLEKQLRYASDEELGKEALTSFVYSGTRYAHPVAGTVAGLNAITVDDVRSFYNTHYTRGSTNVALAGGFDDALVQKFEASLQELPEGDAPAAPAIQPQPIEGRQVLLVSKEGADASISFGFPISARRGERDFYALWIANSWLGEHRNSSSHLYQVIREERGMNYGDYSYIEKFPEGGFRQMPPVNVARNHQLFEVWIRTLPNGNGLFALRAALRELQDLVENGMSEEEFELTRSFLSKYCLHFAETTQERLGYAVDDRFYGIDGEGHLERFRRLMGEITREEVNAALKKHLQLANIKIAIVTGEAERLQEVLTTDGASPPDYTSPKSEEILAEDEEILKVPYSVASEAVTVVPVEQIFGE